jgi:hypothetical protein
MVGLAAAWLATVVVGPAAEPGAAAVVAAGAVLVGAGLTGVSAVAGEADVVTEVGAAALPEERPDFVDAGAPGLAGRAFALEVGRSAAFAQ